MTRRALFIVACVCVTLAMHTRSVDAQKSTQRTFATPEEAVRALATAASSSKTDELLAIFGPDSEELIASSDPANARKGREVFIVALAERWRLESQSAARKTLVIGNESWPFPVPLAKTASGWRFDIAAGKEEVIARRIGRNELAVLAICHGYVRAQRRYAEKGHDGNPPGRFATAFHSEPGKQNGLYWPAKRGEPRSPMGDLVAQAAEEGRAIAASGDRPVPFHGYFFKMLESPGGFALVAWPAEYDVTGVMTFIVNQDGTVREKDLGPNTAATTARLTKYATDATWRPVSPVR
jgi:hypothetical protein